MRDQFNEFVSDYILHRENLCGTFVLVDSRHSPQKIDLQFVAWLIDCEIPFALIFTKTDKIKPKVVQKNINQFKEAMKEFSSGEPIVFQSSASTREGRQEILMFIDEATKKL
jgi:GTP-binding protein